MIQASGWEYRYRYLLHGLIYLLGFAAPWSFPLWNFTRNQSALFRMANALAKPSYLHFAGYWNGIVASMLAFALAGAFLRTWGAAYLGASKVHRSALAGGQLVASGPYRFVRNPLYLGTLLVTLAMALLMRPEAGVLTVLLIGVLQLRLIGREESYLAQQLGPEYAAYRAVVPRIVPALRGLAVTDQQHASWLQGLLSELFVIGCVLAIGIFGWSTGYAWEGSIVHVMQAVLISLGLSFIARAFI